MRDISLIACGLLAWQVAMPAQTSNLTDPTADRNASSESATGVVSDATANTAPDYSPLTASERWRIYLMSTFGPGAIARAVAIGGIDQARGTPKEWRGGAEAFGERIGNSFAEHGVRKTLESGAAALLHEDNRYFRSTDTGFFKRSRHAVVSAFLARNTTGQEVFSFSRVGGTAGASFIWRIWQPRSQATYGDAAVNFGVNMAAHMGWNLVKEFQPRKTQR